MTRALVGSADLTACGGDLSMMAPVLTPFISHPLGHLRKEGKYFGVLKESQGTRDKRVLTIVA